MNLFPEDVVAQCPRSDPFCGPGFWPAEILGHSGHSASATVALESLAEVPFTRWTALL